MLYQQVLPDMAGWKAPLPLLDVLEGPLKEGGRGLPPVGPRLPLLLAVQAGDLVCAVSGPATSGLVLAGLTFRFGEGRLYPWGWIFH